VLPGMQRDIANAVRSSASAHHLFLGAVRSHQGLALPESIQRVWYATTRRPSEGCVGRAEIPARDTAFYVSATDSDTVLCAPNRTASTRPKTYTNKIFPALNKFHDPFRLSVNGHARLARFFVAAGRDLPDRGPRRCCGTASDGGRSSTSTPCGGAPPSRARDRDGAHRRPAQPRRAPDERARGWPVRCSGGSILVRPTPWCRGSSYNPTVGPNASRTTRCGRSPDGRWTARPAATPKPGY